MKITPGIARRLPETPPVVELDVTSDRAPGRAGRPGARARRRAATASCTRSASPRAGALQLPRTRRGTTSSTALHVSAYSLKALGVAALPLMRPRARSIVGLTFDARFAWPVYDWMGVAKAAFESTARYLARDLGPKGVRVNLVAAGPIRTTAAKSIPGFEAFEDIWADRAPLGWDVRDPEPAAAACVALLSDWFPATTGEIVHVDGGVTRWAVRRRAAATHPARPVRHAKSDWAPVRPRPRAAAERAAGRREAPGWAGGCRPGPAAGPGGLLRRDPGPADLGARRRAASAGADPVLEELYGADAGELLGPRHRGAGLGAGAGRGRPRADGKRDRAALAGRRSDRRRSRRWRRSSRRRGSPCCGSRRSGPACRAAAPRWRRSRSRAADPAPARRSRNSWGQGKSGSDSAGRLR